jgi:hypothetical protein
MVLKCNRQQPATSNAGTMLERNIINYCKLKVAFLLHLNAADGRDSAGRSLTTAAANAGNLDLQCQHEHKQTVTFSVRNFTTFEARKEGHVHDYHSLQ